MKIKVARKGVGTELKDCGDANFEIWKVMDQEDLDRRLNNEGVKSLVEMDGSTIASFKALEEGGKYGLGAAKAQQDEVLAFLKAEAAKKEARQKQKDKLAARQRGTIDAIAKHVNKKAKIDLDCWERDSLMSLVRDPLFKASLVEYYGRGAPNGKLKCQVLDRDFPSEHVIGSHIWKAETRGEGLEQFGLKRTDIHNNRNGLLMCKGIEEAFDRKQVCFVYDFLHNQLVFFVADQTLLDRLVFPSKTVKFCDVDGVVLKCGPNSMPYRRILSWHAYLTLEKYGFGENYQPYSRLSEGAPDLEALLSRVQVGAAASDDEGDVAEDAEGKSES